MLYKNCYLYQYYCNFSLLSELFFFIYQELCALLLHFKCYETLFVMIVSPFFSCASVLSRNKKHCDCTVQRLFCFHFNLFLLHWDSFVVISICFCYIERLICCHWKVSCASNLLCLSFSATFVDLTKPAVCLFVVVFSLSFINILFCGI